MEKVEDEFLMVELRSLHEKVDALRDGTHIIDKSLAEYKTAFDLHASSEETLYGELHRMNNILAENTKNLSEHMRRTAQVEDAIIAIHARLTPLEKEQIRSEAVSAWKKETIIRWGKILVAVAAIAGTAITILKFYGH